MQPLTIYDTSGQKYTPTGTTGTNKRIKRMALAGMRIAIKPSEREITGYFRAKETPNSRAEQFYGEYADQNAAGLTGFVNAVHAQLNEWNHTLDESDSSMAVFREISNQRRTRKPGSDKDRRILQELAGNREMTAVGVSDVNKAIGLLQEFADHHSVAIADSTDADVLSQFDIVITIGKHRGINPVGQTTDRWEEVGQALKREFVNKEVNSITESVQTLKQDFGLSGDEIQRKVSGLEATDSGSQNSKLGSDSASSGIKGTLLSPKVGKYIFILGLILILLIGGLWAAGTFVGIGPFADSSDLGGIVPGSAGTANNSEATNSSTTAENGQSTADEETAGQNETSNTTDATDSSATREGDQSTTEEEATGENETSNSIGMMNSNTVTENDQPTTGQESQTQPIRLVEANIMRQKST